MHERLQKILARAGVGSRRHNEAIIAEGRVAVNGKVAKLGDSADFTKDTITLDGKPIEIEQKLYIMLNKPKGILSSTEDERGEDRQTIRDLVEIEGHLYPIGRLDRQSEGLILLTNDGELAHRLTHPRYGHEKTYRVWIERQPSRDTLKKWRDGIMLDDKMTSPAEVEIEKKGGYVTEMLIVMREGRKRQIRRVAAQLGHPVRRLMREKIGPIKLSGLEPGKWRMLNDREVNLLKDRAFRAPKGHETVKPRNKNSNRRHSTTRKRFKAVNRNRNNSQDK